MNNKNTKISIFVALLTLALTLTGCHRMDVGYLKTADASFSPDTVYVYRSIDPTSERALNGSPWTSTRIQGVSGTAPINYSYVSVKVSDGGNAEAFNAIVRDGLVTIQGGLIQLFQKGAARLPDGKYTLTIRVSNEDHEATLQDIFTFVVTEKDF